MSKREGRPARVLVVDDEADLCETLLYNLRREGLDSEAVNNGHNAILRCRSEPAIDLVLLDLMLPDMSGTEVCRALQNAPFGQVPAIIMLTALSEEIDRVVGFEMGADDYVTKPFSPRELMLRVRAVLRRRTKPSHLEEQAPAQYGPLRIDRDAHRIWVDTIEIRLTALEFKLLNTLVDRRGRVQSREVLLSDVWGMNADVTTRTVDTHVKRLRHKLLACGQLIETVRGVGYRLAHDAGDGKPA